MPYRYSHGRILSYCKIFIFCVTLFSRAYILGHIYEALFSRLSIYCTKYWWGLYFRVTVTSWINAKIKSSRIKGVLQYCILSVPYLSLPSRAPPAPFWGPPRCALPPQTWPAPYTSWSSPPALHTPSYCRPNIAPLRENKSCQKTTYCKLVIIRHVPIFAIFVCAHKLFHLLILNISTYMHFWIFKHPKKAYWYCKDVPKWIQHTYLTSFYQFTEMSTTHLTTVTKITISFTLISNTYLTTVLNVILHSQIQNLYHISLNLDE